jgi:hypothetical protein
MVMVACVIRRGNQFEVRGIVVQPVVIPVVNELVACKRTADPFLDDPSVLKDVSTVDEQDLVARLHRPALGVRRLVAVVAAQVLRTAAPSVMTLRDYLTPAPALAALHSGILPCGWSR